MSAPVAVLGGGTFGRGLAVAAARAGHDVLLWSRTPRAMPTERIEVTADVARLARAELLFVAVPSPHVAEVCAEVGPHLDGRHLLVHVSRGLVGEDLTTLSMVMRHATPSRRVGALAGPLTAEALMTDKPGGAVVGTRFPEVADAVREAIAGPTLRIYDTADVIGVEVASAMVGLLALVTGFGRAMKVGAAGLAVVTTRGMAEAAKLGEVLGGDAGTFFGLAGFGDVLAAAHDDGRPELLLGEALAQGKPLAEAAALAGAHIEGVAIARQVTEYAARSGFDMPIAETVAQVLAGELSPQEALLDLMARRVGRE